MTDTITPPASTQTTVAAQVDNPNFLDPLEQVFLLDGEDYVAVSVEVSRNSVTHAITAKAKARFVLKSGEPVLDAHDQAVESEHTRSCEADFINDSTVGGVSGLAKDAVLLVLGDENDALGDNNDNIRYAIQAAASTGPVDPSVLAAIFPSTGGSS